MRKDMRGDGKYRRTKLTVLRTAQTKGESRFTIGGQVKKGAHAPRPITLPKMPWNNDVTPADENK
jgi:hypothetical protein